MAMIDRLKDATRSTNSIEAVQPSPALQRPVDLHGANPGVSANAPPPPKKEAKDPKAPAYTTEPEAISRAYYVEDKGRERRYFDDYQRKNLSIRADDSSISTKKEDLVTIRAMLTMVEARGWSEVKVSGTADFKRETWIEAQARGIAAQGYKASDIDRQEADRRRAERGLAPVQAGPKQDVNEVRTVTTPAGPAVAVASQAVQNLSPATLQQRDAEPSRPGTDLHRANRDLAPNLPQQPTASTYALSARNLGVVPSSPVAVKEAPDQQPTRAPSDLHRANPSSPATAAPGPSTPIQATQAVGQKPAQQEATPVVGQKPTQPEATPMVNHRQALKDATAELSPDGRLVLAALSEKIDRQMNKLNADAKLETKAFAAAELVKKERAEGPVVLSPELRRQATAPEPAQVRETPAPVQQPALVRQVEPQPAQRSRSR